VRRVVQRLEFSSGRWLVALSADEIWQRGRSPSDVRSCRTRRGPKLNRLKGQVGVFTLRQQRRVNVITTTTYRTCQLCHLYTVSGTLTLELCTKCCLLLAKGIVTRDMPLDGHSSGKVRQSERPSQMDQTTISLDEKSAGQSITTGNGM
jgi:hypothetical protein